MDVENLLSAIGLSLTTATLEESFAQRCSEEHFPWEHSGWRWFVVILR
jgi:hypothetical protein